MAGGVILVGGPADYPLEAKVASGVPYAFGAKTGTLSDPETPSGIMEQPQEEVDP